MVARVLALLLAFAMLPAGWELVEVAVHAAQHGDLAHAGDAAHDDEPLGQDEHGCTGLFHFCACCHAVQPTGRPSVTAVATPAARSWRPDVVAPAALDGRGPPAPPIRPPIG